MNADVLVIGAGPAGLATAAELQARGVTATVLERGPQPGAAWAARYDGLRLNTSRHLSALPGAPFPRSYGQFPTRDQYLAYLRDYSTARGVAVTAGVAATKVRRDNGAWQVHTSTGPRHARHVVVATGGLSEPRVPAWAEKHVFTGDVLHAANYRSPAPFAGRTVVVVGAGSSGFEIAHQLATGGAARVLLSVRTPPNILLREVNGVPGDLPVPLLLHLPTAVVDRLLFAVQRRSVGDLSRHGLPFPTEGAMAQLRARGAGVAVVDAAVLQSIRSGAIQCVPAVVGLAADSVHLADGRDVPADAVILATGYGTGLGRLVGGLGVLDERGMPLEVTGREAAPGLRFVGYVARPGLTRYVGALARRAARGIATTP